MYVNLYINKYIYFQNDIFIILFCFLKNKMQMEFDNKSKNKYQNDVAIIGLGFRLTGNSNSPKLFWFVFYF